MTQSFDPTLPDELHDAPLSDRAVYQILCRDGPLSRTDVCRRLALSDTAFQDAIDRLQRRGFVSAQRDRIDNRRHLYEAEG